MVSNFSHKGVGFCVGGDFCYQQKRTHLFTGIITCILGIIAFWQHPFDAQFGESFFGELFQYQITLPDPTDAMHLPGDAVQSSIIYRLNIFSWFNISIMLFFLFLFQKTKSHCLCLCCFLSHWNGFTTSYHLTRN